jgi:hypothetical protein
LFSGSLFFSLRLIQILLALLPRLPQVGSRMAGRRRLFIAHAHELAHRLVQTIARGGMVEQFVRSYAERHNRRKLTGDPVRLREMESTIGREALLAIAVEVRRLAPRAFTDGHAAPGAVELSLAQTFFSEFVAAVGRSLEWPPADMRSEMQAFERDLELYWRWSQRPGESSRGRAAHEGQGPFPDRCAILLDPPMMEQARRAAAGFEAEVVRMGVRAFSQLGRQSSGIATRAPRPTRRPPRAAKKAGIRAARALRRERKKSRRTKSRHPQSRRTKSRRPARRPAKRPVRRARGIARRHRKPAARARKSALRRKKRAPRTRRNHARRRRR